VVLQIEETATADGAVLHGLWGRAFRPFFLGLSVYAALVVPWWLAVTAGIAPAPGWLVAPWWHGHEMVFGVVAAAIAGFLLTASPVWVGRRALAGAPLAALFGLWAAGRIAMAAAGWLPAWLVAAVDASCLPAVAGVVARTLWGSGRIGNHAVVGLVVALASANAAMHAQALALGAGGAGAALRLGVDLVVVLMLVISGRITPAFTRNAFARDGIAAQVRSWPWLDLAAIAAAAALAVATLTFGRGAVTGALATLAGVAAAGRLAGWQTWHTRADPLLWSLHAGSAWIASGLLLTAAADLGLGVPAAAGLHALTAGAMGSLILAVITRVGLGHTGRALVVPSGVVACYALVHAGAALRVASTFAGGDLRLALLVAGGLAWAAAFAGYALRYAPILTRPRPDGRPG
jgi:uncharacterized protein involved in response to NO